MTAAPTPFMRPLRLAELLDQAVRLYRNNFLKFIGILAIPYIPLVIFQSLTALLLSDSLARGMNDPNVLIADPAYWLGMSGSFFTLIITFFLVQGVATAALTRAVADNYTGRPVGILESYKRLGSSWFRLILALLLIIVVWVVLLVWAIIPCVGWLTGPGILLFVGMVTGPLVAPVIVLEKRDVLGSIRRAWDLGRSRFWWLLGFAFILYLFGQLLVTGPTMVVSFIMQYLTISSQITMEQQMIWSNVAQTLVSMIFSLLYLPLQLTAMTIVYFDLRVRSEGLDLAMQAADSPEAKMEIALPEISSQSKTPLITGKEIGYFVILTLAGGALYMLIVSVLFGLMMAAMPLGAF
jgi:hypothetical protein